MKNYLKLIPMFALMLCLSGCQGCNQKLKTFKADTIGLQRTITLYDYNGQVIQTWNGKVRLDTTETGTKFIIDGKQIIIQNGIVVVTEE